VGRVRRGPVIDAPLTESIGASSARRWFAVFPAFNQIVSEAARIRYRSNNGYGVPMTIRARTAAASTAYTAIDAFTHAGLEGRGASTPRAASSALDRDEDPVLFEHKKMYRSVRGEVPDTDYTVPLRGRAG
jgi:2-oxoisovalerate dehydrogenase E1 component beta subunit